MIFEEINFIPPLEIGKTTCQQTKSTLGLFIYLFIYLLANPLRLNQTIQIISSHLGSAK
jgi:hypothetical protein